MDKDPSIEGLWQVPTTQAPDPHLCFLPNKPHCRENVDFGCPTSCVIIDILYYRTPQFHTLIIEMRTENPIARGEGMPKITCSPPCRICMALNPLTAEFETTCHIL